MRFPPPAAAPPSTPTGGVKPISKTRDNIQTRRAVTPRPNKHGERIEMRTPSLFIGVFALTLILLLLACRGSDEPTDGPSSERSTAPADLTRATDDSDTPASPAPTPSTPGSGAAPTATGYAETDREALVALYTCARNER